MRESVVDEGPAQPDGTAGAARSAVQAPRMVPKIDYERIFVLDEGTRLLGEYALRDDCPLEYDDLLPPIPVSGMRHLVAFYHGHSALTPVRAEVLWRVVSVLLHTTIPE